MEITADCPRKQAKNLNDIWLQTPHSSQPDFTCRRDRLDNIAAIKIEAQGYRDHGPFIL
jgi:hypothetical protein